MGCIEKTNASLKLIRNTCIVIFQTFLGPLTKFKYFPGLEEFKHIQGIQGPVRTL